MPEREIDDSFIVVRGGIKRTFEALGPDIDDAIAQNYGPVLSVFVDGKRGTETIEETLYRICDDADLANKQIQVSTIGDLRSAGFRIDPYVEEGWAWNHCHVFFDEPVSESQVIGFVLQFGDPTVNPTGGKKRR